MKQPRVNKPKEQLISEAKHVEKVNREKTLVKMMFPHVATQKTIYDAQTALSALSGFIKFGTDTVLGKLTVKDLKIDLSKEESSEVKTAILNIMGLIELENAKEMAGLLERFGNTLAQYSANQFMKKPMSDITIDDIVSK